MILLVACLLMAACTPSDPAPDTEASPSTPSSPAPNAPSDAPPSPTLTALPSFTPETNPTDTPRARIPSPTLGANYTLAVQFDYHNHFLSVGEAIAFTNNSGETLFELILVVEPNRWPGAFRLNSLTWGDGTPVADYALTGNRLKIPLDQPMHSGAEASLSLSYELTLPEIPDPSDTTRPVPFGYTARQTNVVDWYPFLPPYRPGTGWMVHNPWYYGEHQVYDTADYRVEVQLAYPVQDLTIAASAPVVQEDDRFRYTLEGARSFAFSASQSYIVLSNTVGEVEVTSYAFPYDRVGGEAALQYASEALELYSELFGPYPHPMLSIVEADFLDGMEYSGMFFLSRGFYNIYDGTPGGYLTAIAVHETAHQWWYEQVGNDQALEPWLDEALCTYAERLYYEHAHPELLDFWWAFRVNFYEPVGWVNGSIYDYSGFRPYRDAVYLRGAQFLEELRTLIGDETFFAFLRDYAARYRGHQVTAYDFFALLGEHTSADINALRTTYFDPAK
jgi:hypothetical protein